MYTYRPEILCISQRKPEKLLNHQDGVLCGKQIKEFISETENKAALAAGTPVILTGDFCHPFCSISSIGYDLHSREIHKLHVTLAANVSAG